MLVSLMGSLSSGLAETRDPSQMELLRLRSERRALSNALQKQADKTDGPLLSGLLVIPVDFSDARLDPTWDAHQELSGRMYDPQEESLRRYFLMASRDRLDLRITIAPLIRLPGTRRDYSDKGFQGFSRTRKLATEAIEAVRSLGLEFRSLDMEGPDRRPGSEDDDGQLDGVLILHAGIGQENDPDDGLIQPLQFYLDEPVVSSGISASFYAVASLHSGPGIWAHETGHLLGMEDRYDPLLHPDPSGVDVRSLGGLGRFSLMASGAWGTGDGWGAALPDAYTCWQLGWYDEYILPGIYPDGFALEQGMAARIWTHGNPETEFFLLEVRDPARNFPFDANVPANQMLVYHIDETVPEGSWSSDGPGQWHLRARLVEADDNDSLARGDDDGGLADLFPGSGGVTEFGPGTAPSSWGYQGNSLVQLLDITQGPEQIQFTPVAHLGPELVFDFGFTGSYLTTVDLAVRSAGEPVTGLTCQIEALPGGHAGFFQGNSQVHAFELFENSPGQWLPADDVLFQLWQVPGPGDATEFSLTFSAGDWTSEPVIRRWLWQGETNPLDLSGPWPGDWVVQDLSEGTTWHRWTGPPYLDGREEPVLIATGATFDNASYWPENRYANSAHTLLATPELGPEVLAVRLVHAMGAERLETGEAMDGGRLVWLGPAGSRLPALPADGYTNQILSQANNPLAGQPVFADTLVVDSLGQPYWQVDVVRCPDTPGPWRLGLEFASNTLWRRQGWVVADLSAITWNDFPDPFPVAWEPGTGLTWSWLYGDPLLRDYSIQTSGDPADGWTDARTGLLAGTLTRSEVMQILGPAGISRRQLRVVANTNAGPVVSRPVTIYQDGGYQAEPGISRPRLNPGGGEVSVQVSIPQGQRATLKIFDLRGHLLHHRDVPSGQHLIRWEGTDNHGRRQPSGVYFLRLEGSGPPQTRKVVLLR